jgi:hypothetical protein
MAHAHPGSDGRWLADGFDHRPQFVGLLPGAEQLAFGALMDPLDAAQPRRLVRDPGLVSPPHITKMPVSRESM